MSIHEQPNLDTTRSANLTLTATTRNFREEYENCLKLAAACDERLKTFRIALAALKATALENGAHNHRAGPLLKIKPLIDNTSVLSMLLLNFSTIAVISPLTTTTTTTTTKTATNNQQPHY